MDLDQVIIKNILNSRDKRHFSNTQNLKKAYWSVYHACLEEFFCDETSLLCENVQTLYDHFVVLMQKATDKNIPLLKVYTDPTRTFKTKKYWSPVLSNAVAQRW